MYIFFTHVVDCLFKAPTNGSLQLAIRYEAAENKHICCNRSMYERYHSRTRFNSRPGIRVVCPSGLSSMTCKTSHNATHVWTSPASARSRSKDLIVGYNVNCITFPPIIDANDDLVVVVVVPGGNPSKPDPSSILDTDLHIRANRKHFNSSATFALCKHKSTRVGKSASSGYNLYRSANRERWTTSGAIHSKLLPSSLLTLCSPFSIGNPSGVRFPWSTTLNT